MVLSKTGSSYSLLKMKMTLFWALGLFFSSIIARGFEVFSDSRNVEADWADGDSFRVSLSGEREVTLRLYFIDCPETSVARESDRRRILAQSRHFGVPNPAATYQAGLEARARTQELLAEPFTVYTTFADAMGRSGFSRYYGYVQLADGRWLHEILVAEGWARVFGVGRMTPIGVIGDVHREQLRDLELIAAVKRAGLWANMDLDRLAELREASRAEDSLLAQVQASANGYAIPDPGEPVNINTAPHGQLMLLPGVGEVLADRILDARPFAEVDDLLQVHGIGDTTLDQLRPYVVVDDPR